MPTPGPHRRGRALWSKTAGGAALLTAATLSSFECTPFGSASPDEPARDASTTEEASADSSGVSPEAGNAPDAGDVDASVPCFDLTRPGHGFTLAGSATPTAEGVRVVVYSPQAPSYVGRTFEAPKPFNRSRVMVTAVPEPLDGAMTDPNALIDVLAQYYGPGVSQDAPETAATVFRLGSTGPNLVTTNGADKPGSFALSELLPLSSTASTVQVTTTWAQNGLVVVEPGSPREIRANTAAITSTKLSVFVGGKKYNGAPNLAMTISKICVALE
ncbi:MAG: hypothetical protein K0S65_1105 [Labilithrix sp.]|nr:hypothetical protein [Labilithrix sp.]